MKPLFHVKYDPATHILHLRMMGFWSLETVERFGLEIARVVSIIGRRDFDVLSESVDFPVQSQEVSDALAAMTAQFQSGWAGRTALAVKRVLNKMQVDRTITGPKVRAFLTVAEAMAWLRPGAETDQG